MNASARQYESVGDDLMKNGDYESAEFAYRHAMNALQVNSASDDDLFKLVDVIKRLQYKIVKAAEGGAARMQMRID